MSARGGVARKVVRLPQQTPKLSPFTLRRATYVSISDFDDCTTPSTVHWRFPAQHQQRPSVQKWHFRICRFRASCVTRSMDTSSTAHTPESHDIQTASTTPKIPSLARATSSTHRFSPSTARFTMKLRSTFTRITSSLSRALTGRISFKNNSVEQSLK